MSGTPKCRQSRYSHGPCLSTLANLVPFDVRLHPVGHMRNSYRVVSGPTVAASPLSKVQPSCPCYSRHFRVDQSPQDRRHTTTVESFQARVGAILPAMNLAGGDVAELLLDLAQDAESMLDVRTVPANDPMHSSYDQTSHQDGPAVAVAVEGVEAVGGTVGGPSEDCDCDPEGWGATKRSCLEKVIAETMPISDWERPDRKMRPQRMHQHQLSFVAAAGFASNLEQPKSTAHLLLASSFGDEDHL